VGRKQAWQVCTTRPCHTTNFLLLLNFLHDLLTNLTRLDALVNNAAVAIPPGPLVQQMSQCFQTNATGPLLMLESFAPLLKKSNGTPRVVNVSSGGGSITKRLDPTSPGYNIKSVQYRASKSALNMVTACQAVEYGGQGFKVFAYCPGFTVSNLGPHNNAENGAQPTSEGAAPIVKILNGERDAEHGGFLHGTGQHPW
jgi:NAD(P)-dependent dehydrogenase (short-subunit alcohol dehydrogenase family)